MSNLWVAELGNAKNTPHTHMHLPKDYASAKMGMWLFLYTEILLFGGLFLMFAAKILYFPAEFRECAGQLDLLLGSINTFVLLTSSITMGFCLTALRRGNQNLCLAFLWITIALAAAFLVIKGFEWAPKIMHGVYPNSEALTEGTELDLGKGMLFIGLGHITYFSLYYVMTGLHAVHVIVGVMSMFYVIRHIYKGLVHQKDFVKLENAGLYWDLVHLVWVFLFPIFYLIR